MTKLPSSGRLLIDSTRTVVHVYNGPVRRFIEDVHLLTHLLLSTHIPNIDETIAVVSGDKKITAYVMTLVGTLMLPRCRLLTIIIIKLLIKEQEI